MTIVAGLALVVGAAQCGHEEANGDDEESAQATAEEAESSEAESSDKSEPSDEESAGSTETTESGMMTSTKQRISNPDVDASTVEKLAADNAAFGFDLYQQLRKAQPEANLFYSPHNLSHVLAMVYGGAEGETEGQIKETLRWELAGEKVHSTFNMLDSILQQKLPQRQREKGGDEPENVLETANGVWSQKGMSLKADYLDVLASHYGTGVRPTDFKASPEEARTAINDWAEKKTKGNIEDLMPEGSVSPQTRMVLTAAIYFRGRWGSTFDEKKTAEADFQNLGGETATVQMMHQRNRRGWSYTEGDNYEAVELPYGNGAYGMVVVVPDKGAFETVETSVDGDFAQSVFDGLEGSAVDLKLPTFEVSGQFSAKKHLAALGMTNPFSKENADFSAMTSDRELFLDDVLHKARVSVDEEGTEAAAASAAAMGVTGLPGGEPDWKKVRVDRPFLFMIRHADTDTILFIGRVAAL